MIDWPQLSSERVLKSRIAFLVLVVVLVLENNPKIEDDDEDDYDYDFFKLNFKTRSQGIRLLTSAATRF